MITVAGCRSIDDDEYPNDNSTDTTPGNTPDHSIGTAAALEEAEEILRLLNERIGSDGFVDFFREMMNEHSEDLGLRNFPDGYVFREGDMVEEFFEATIGLEIGEISGIVETMYGYHIIMRLPIDYDSMPIPPPGAPPTSLRQLAAMEDFDLRRYQWLSAVESNLEFSHEYEALDLAIVFENGIDFDEAFSKFAPDTAMISSGDFIISWAHLYVFLFRIVYELFQMNEAMGSEVDWQEDIEGYTVEELVLKFASDEAISFISYMYGIEANNIILSDDDLQSLDENIEEVIAMYGSKEEFEESLRNNTGYYNFEIFMELVTIEFGVSVLVEALYGEEGSGFPDALVEKYVESNGYLMAMHILRLKPGF
jgi:hypothetical protein